MSRRSIYEEDVKGPSLLHSIVNLKEFRSWPVDLIRCVSVFASTSFVWTKGRNHPAVKFFFER